MSEHYRLCGEGPDTNPEQQHNQPKFTPGPWHIDNDYDVADASGLFIAELFDNSSGNGPLVAEAPKLYDELASLVALLEQSEEHDIEEETLAACRRVLAKAEGRSL